SRTDFAFREATITRRKRPSSSETASSPLSAALILLRTVSICGVSVPGDCCCAAVFCCVAVAAVISAIRRVTVTRIGNDSATKTRSGARVLCLTAAAVSCVVVLVAQDASFRYPAARKSDTRDNYFVTSVADPYRWMEDLNSPELKQWIDAQNVVTTKYLDALPVRDALKARITELYNYPRV